MTNPTQALDAIEQALQGVLPFAKECKHHENNGKYPGKPVFSFNDVPLTFDALNLIPEALAHLATLKQQVAELVAFREAHQWRLITELTRDIKGEVLFIERIGGDSSIEDTFAGTYCDTKEHGEYWFDCFVNPSANAIPFRDVVKHYTHFLVAPPPAAEGGQGGG